LRFTLALAFTALILLVLTPVYATRSKLVGVYFYPWYFISEGRHWDNTVRDTPVIGYYDSNDPDTIRWQLKLIRDAGIDFIVFSWWGPNSYEDNTAKIIVKYLREYGLKFAIMIEPYLGNDPSMYDKAFWENTLSYLKTNYIEPYSNIYMHLNGKPLVMAYNPIGMRYNPKPDFPEYTIRITGNDIDNARYQDWDYWPDYIDPYNVNLRVRINGYVSIIPRYDDTHFRTPGKCLDQNYTILLYQKEWEWILKNRDKVSIVMITSWNEYHERTMIEPHIDATANVHPFYIYELTAKYIKMLKQQPSSYSSAIASLGAGMITGTVLVLLGFKILTRMVKRW